MVGYDCTSFSKLQTEAKAGNFGHIPGMPMKLSLWKLSCLSRVHTQAKCVFTTTSHKARNTSNCNMCMGHWIPSNKIKRCLATSYYSNGLSLDQYVDRSQQSNCNINSLRVLYTRTAVPNSNLNHMELWNYGKQGNLFIDRSQSKRWFKGEFVQGAFFNLISNWNHSAVLIGSVHFEQITLSSLMFFSYTLESSKLFAGRQH